VTRSLEDKNNFDNPGSGTPSKLSSPKRSADPPKNKSGMAGAVKSFNETPDLSTLKMVFASRLDKLGSYRRNLCSRVAQRCYLRCTIHPTV